MTAAGLRQILSKNIKSLRNQRSLSQIELAEKADISIPFLSNIERGNKWPHPETLVKIAVALDVEVYTLFQEKTSPLPAIAREALVQFKNDVSVSLHKSIKAAIDTSLDTIGSHYIDNDKK